jgi:cytochrome P450 family 6
MGVLIYLFIGFITAAYFYIRNKYQYFKNRGIPNEDPSFLLGNIGGVGETIHLAKKIQVIYEKFKNGNKMCGFYLLQSPRLLITDLDLIKNILIKDFHNFADRGIFNDAENDPLSAHLFSLEGKEIKFIFNSIFQPEIKFKVKSGRI